MYSNLHRSPKCNEFKTSTKTKDKLYYNIIIFISNMAEIFRLHVEISVPPCIPLIKLNLPSPS
jgi:hypothetical protein